MRPTTILGAVALVLAAVACGKRTDINGVWTSTPVNMPGIAHATTASSILNIDFDAPKGAKSGPVTLTMIIDVTQPIHPGASDSFDAPYEVSVTGTASISGRWSYEDGDDDDILLFLDNSSLTVNVDPNGVSFSQNLLTGTHQQTVDSLSSVTADRWRSAVRTAAARQFFEYTKLDDVKVSANDILSCELGHRDMTFHRSSAEF